MNIIIDIQRKEILNGQAFEILNQETMRIAETIFTELFKEIKKTSVVVTIIGTQNSGKSTLLNSLFGYDFKIKEDKSVKGVFGTFYNVSSSSKINCESIFLVDTEGLLSFENKNVENICDYD